MTPIVFLDMDGVLIPRPGPSEIDRGCLGRLHAILQLSNACVVVTSAWGMKAMPVLQRAGIMRIIGVTKDDSLVRRVRGYQVDRWLKSTFLSKGKTPPYLILDDVDDYLEDQKPWLVLTEMAKGFDESTYFEAQDKLQKQGVQFWAGYDFVEGVGDGSDRRD